MVPRGQLTMNKVKTFFSSHWIIGALLIGGGLLSACQQGGEQQQAVKVEETTEKASSYNVKQLNVPGFNEDTAYYFVKKQVAFGPRVPNTPAHKKCGEWLVKKFEQYADEVEVQKGVVTTYKDEKLPIKNIEVAFKPKKKRRIMLCAHWDTRPFADHDDTRKDEPILGANDGGSGVAVLLEIARQLHKKAPNIGVDIILFDAEDYGPPAGRKKRAQASKSWCLGAQYWATHHNQSTYNPLYGILLDMVGAKQAQFTMEGHSMENAPGVVRKIWSIGTELGYQRYFKFDKTEPILDDHYYINNKAHIPCINIVHYDYATPTHFGPFWHTHDDNMDIIDRNTLESVGSTVLHTLFYEAQQKGVTS